MRPCDSCAVVREHYRADPWGYRLFNPGCLHCGGRIIQVLRRKMGLGQAEVRERCRAALARWMGYGHDEAEIRALAKSQAWAVAPKPETVKEKR